MQKITSQTLYKNVKALVDAAKYDAAVAINATMLETNFLIGKQIVEYEQAGHPRPGYADKSLQILSARLGKQFGKGFSVDNLENMRKFYLAYKKSETVSRKSSVAKK